MGRGSSTGAPQALSRRGGSGCRACGGAAVAGAGAVAAAVAAAESFLTPPWFRLAHPLRLSRLRASLPPRKALLVHALVVCGGAVFLLPPGWPALRAATDDDAAPFLQLARARREARRRCRVSARCDSVTNGVSSRCYLPALSPRTHWMRRLHQLWPSRWEDLLRARDPVVSS